MYLENIFKAGDVKKALQQESNMFDLVDKFFRNHMVKAQKLAKARNLITQQPKIVDDLKNQNAQLDYIQKKISQYLETKRNAFPRFYFLSDDELLEILANSDDKNIVQGYLKALFDGIVKLVMTDLEEIKTMRSKEGELVDMSKMVKTTGNVEQWLLRVQIEMKDTILKRLKEGNRDYIGTPGKAATPRKDWVLAHPA